MYSLDAHVTALWRQLFERVARRAGVALEVIEHLVPRPLARLWERDDIGCVFMCGYPWSTWPRSETRPRLLAVPLPRGERYAGRPVYCSDIVVRRDAPFSDVDGLRGTRFAFTVESSQSGWQAPRAFFAEHALRSGGRWFGETVGPLVTPRAVVDAVIEGRADAGPLDSYWHDLLQLHAPASAAQLRVVASTSMTPMPALVCAPSTPDDVRQRLVEVLLGIANDDALRAVREGLAIRGFALPVEDDYSNLARRARALDARGYARLQ